MSNPVCVWGGSCICIYLFTKCKHYLCALIRATKATNRFKTHTKTNLSKPKQTKNKIYPNQIKPHTIKTIKTKLKHTYKNTKTIKTQGREEGSLRVWPKLL